MPSVNDVITSTDQLWFSIAGFVFFYTVLLVIEHYLMFKYVQLGPSSLHTGRYHFEERIAPLGIRSTRGQLLSILFLLLIAVNLPVFAVEPASSARLDEVAELGRQVMPFDLQKTTHVFTKTNDGGRQEVLVKSSKDKEQIRLIREHLSAIAANFAKGDFSGPAQIHGDDMPGLAEMKSARPGQVKFAYRELPKGARIDYSTHDRVLIDAIHTFFDAQLSDHTHHAMAGGSHHHTHGQ